MKIPSIFLILLLFNSLLTAQVPQKMSYQAVIRNSSEELVTNKQIGMRISIQKYVMGLPPSYQNVYVETQTPTTNENGLVSISVGGGTVDYGNFADINWADGTYYIRTETDPAGGTSYTITGRSQLLSVPYAFHARGLKTYKVGDFAHGGVIFYVDETGQHGLVCAKMDFSSNYGIRWDAGTYTNTMARRDGYYAGEMNTTLILASQGLGDGNDYAARLCSEMKLTEGGITYGDWYLPSLEELRLVMDNIGIINATALANGGSKFALSGYWSSTESDVNKTWYISNAGYGSEPSPKNTTYRVRAIRAF
jgi:hypothetical protein